MKELLTFSVDSIPTDLCSWALTFGKTSSIVESNPLNLKITRKEDLDLAEVFSSLFQKISSDI